MGLVKHRAEVDPSPAQAADQLLLLPWGRSHAADQGPGGAAQTGGGLGQ